RHLSDGPDLDRHVGVVLRGRAGVLPRAGRARPLGARSEGRASRSAAETVRAATRRGRRAGGCGGAGAAGRGHVPGQPLQHVPAAGRPRQPQRSRRGTGTVGEHLLGTSRTGTSGPGGRVRSPRRAVAAGGAGRRTRRSRHRDYPPQLRERQNTGTGHRTRRRVGAGGVPVPAREPMARHRPAPDRAAWSVADQARGTTRAVDRAHTQPPVSALSDTAHTTTGRRRRHRPVTGAPCTARTGTGISGAALADTEGVRTCRRARPCPRSYWTG